MTVGVVLAITAIWLLLSLVASLLVAAVGRGGLREDRARGYLVDRH